MRGDVPAYELRAPATLTEALAMLAEAPGTLRCFAGGTDSMVLLASGKLSHTRYVDIGRFKELRGIDVQKDDEQKDVIVLGALTTYSDVQASKLLRAEYPMLVQAASETGGWANQNRGTLGGNIANASPAADSPPALLAYDAEIVLRSAAGTRVVPYAAFHTGYKTTVRKDDEIVAQLRLPRKPAAHRLHFYRKVGPRRAQAISKVCIAASVDRDETGAITRARVAFGGVAPTPVRALGVEKVLEAAASPGTSSPGTAPTALPSEGALVAALGTSVSPIDDIRSTARYRRRVAENLLRELLSKLAESRPHDTVDVHPR